MKWCVTQDKVEEGGKPSVPRLSRLEAVVDGLTVIANGSLTVGLGGFKETCQQLYQIRAGVEGPEDLARIVEEKAFCTRCGAFDGHKTFCRVPEEEAKAAERALERLHSAIDVIKAT